jgi:hypothetical protein
MAGETLPATAARRNFVSSSVSEECCHVINSRVYHHDKMAKERACQRICWFHQATAAL